jgi:uncharacterized membrane protein
MLRSVAVIGLAFLAACSPKPAATPAAPKKGTVSDFSKPLDARGTEPFWTLAIRGTTLTLTRPNQAPLTAVAPGVLVQPNQASWTGKTADGREMKVIFYSSTCSDGMSERAYAYSAEVDLPGESPLTGCADTAAAPAKARKP